jgi:hypothetical protein
MDMQKMEENKCFNWVEPTLIIMRSRDDHISYILYNKIINFSIGEEPFKMVTIEVPKHKSDYIKYIYDYRTEYAKYLKNLYPESYNTDSGFSSLIDAIKSTNEDLILLYKNYTLIGSASYSIIDKKKTIDVTHIGVIERRKKYGTFIMNSILSTAKILQYSVTATSNGYADDFYHSLNMKRIIDKPLGIYIIQANYIGDMS